MIKYIIPLMLLIIALALSSMSAYYSVVGLMMIFSGGMYGFIFMECAKISTTLFLHKHWNDGIGVLKTWLTLSVVILALITSMGVFGYLSKASTGKSETVTINSSKIVFLEESIQREKDKLQQGINQINIYNDSISRLITDNPLKASNERKRLQKEINIITQENKIISNNIDKLYSELLPYKSEIKKHEVEIGPLLYITRLVYGEDYKEHSEKTLTYLILIIVLVFDPLAISLLIASQKAFYYIGKKPEQKFDNDRKDVNIIEDITDTNNIIDDIILDDSYRKEKMPNKKSQM